MIHFVRHAEAVSNAAAHKYPQGSPARNEEYQKQEYFNAALSGKGKLQAADLAGHLARLMKDSELGEGGPRQNFLVVSTLQRTLDTASIGLAGREQSFTWIASDSIREWAEGESHPCDYRGSLKEDDVSSRYPWIDFSACEDEDPIKPDESLDSVRARIIAFVTLLRSEAMKDAERVVVVTHSAFLSELWSGVLKNEEEMRFSNCQVRSVEWRDFMEKVEACPWFQNHQLFEEDGA